MNKPRVSYEQAVRLKAVGYDVPCNAHYEHTKKETKFFTSMMKHNWNTSDEYGMKARTIYCSAPELDDVCRSLRDVHWLHVTVDLWQTDLTTEPIQHEWKSDIANMDDKEDAYNYTSGTYTEHDAAQSAAIDACLTIIEERKKTQQ